MRMPGPCHQLPMYSIHDGLIMLGGCLQDGPGMGYSEDDDMDVSEEDPGDSPRAAGAGSFSRRSGRGIAALGQDQQAGEDDGEEFRAGSGSEEEDDEATLEEEEVTLHSAISSWTRSPIPACAVVRDRGSCMS